MNTNQIAAEAAMKTDCLVKEATHHIQAAIEKAREEGYEAGYRDGGFAASRAAHASECICDDGFGMNLSCPVHGVVSRETRQLAAEANIAAHASEDADQIAVEAAKNIAAWVKKMIFATFPNVTSYDTDCLVKEATHHIQSAIEKAREAEIKMMLPLLKQEVTAHESQPLGMTGVQAEWADHTHKNHHDTD